MTNSDRTHGQPNPGSDPTHGFRKLEHAARRGGPPPDAELLACACLRQARQAYWSRLRLAAFALEAS